MLLPGADYSPQNRFKTASKSKCKKKHFYKPKIIIITIKNLGLGKIKNLKILTLKFLQVNIFRYTVYIQIGSFPVCKIPEIDRSWAVKIINAACISPMENNKTPNIFYI